MPGLLEQYHYWSRGGAPAAPPTYTYEESVLALLGADIVAYWPADETSGTLVDVSGNGWNASKFGAGTPSYRQTGPTINGVAQYAVQVDGSCYFVTSGSITPASATTGRTLAAWVYLPSTSSASGRFLARASTGQSEAVLTHASDGTGGFNAYQSDGNTLIASANSTDMDGDTWRHIIGWWDPSTQDCYVSVNNGGPVSAAGSTNIKTDSTQSYGIAATPVGTSLLRSGSRVCHLLIVHRVLTSDERTKLATGVF